MLYGLWNLYYHYRLFLKLEKMQQLEGVVTPVQAILSGGEDAVNGMILEDFLGIFAFYLCCIGANLLFFSGEYWKWWQKKRQLKKLTVD